MTSPRIVVVPTKKQVQKMLAKMLMKWSRVYVITITTTVTRLVMYTEKAMYLASSRPLILIFLMEKANIKATA